MSLSANLSQPNNCDVRKFTWSLINCRSVKNKLTDLHYLLNTGSTDILVLTETWLDVSIPNSIVAPNGIYRVFRHDRASAGGGVAILVKDCILTKLVTIDSVFDHLEIVAVDLKFGDTQYRVASFYSLPGINIDDLKYLSDAVKCFQMLSSTHHVTVILGDFGSFTVVQKHQSILFC